MVLNLNAQHLNNFSPSKFIPVGSCIQFYNFCKYIVFIIIDFHNTISFVSFRFDRAKRKATNMALRRI